MDTNSIKAALLNKLRGIRYRRAFADSSVGTHIAAQLRALRLSRQLSQEKLAKRIRMGQARISLMESPNYQKYNLRTLRRMASFYDVALVVDFVSFKDLLNRIVDRSPASLAPVCFDDVFAVPKQEQIPLPIPSAQVTKPQPANVREGEVPHTTEKPSEESANSSLKKFAEQFEPLKRSPLEELAVM